MDLSQLFMPLLLVGLFCSIALPLTLGELLMSPDNHVVKKYSLIFSGLLACLYVTGLNFFIFTILTMTNDFDIDWELAGSRKSKAYGIMGYGTVMSYLFIIGCLVKYFGNLQTYKLKKHHRIIVGYTYKIFKNLSNNKSEDEGRARIRKLKKSEFILIYFQLMRIQTVLKIEWL